jgi:hypothetical protein
MIVEKLSPLGNEIDIHVNVMSVVMKDFPGDS